MGTNDNFNGYCHAYQQQTANHHKNRCSCVCFSLIEVCLFDGKILSCDFVATAAIFLSQHAH